MNKLISSNLDTIVVLDFSGYTISNAILCWLEMKRWLNSKGFIYNCSYGGYMGLPHSLLMDSQDAVVFKLVFEI